MKARKSHIFAKAKYGWYQEPEWCSARLFAEEKFHGLIWDPACGGGNILKSAGALGYSTFGSDIIKRGRIRPRFVKSDFLTDPIPFHQQTFNVVTNPPFDHVEEFARRALEHGASKVALIFLLRRLPAAHWLEELPLRRVWLLTPRPSMPPGEWIKAGNAPGGGTQDFVWLMFDRQRKAGLDLRWLHRDKT